MIHKPACADRAREGRLPRAYTFAFRMKRTLGLQYRLQLGYSDRRRRREVSEVDSPRASDRATVLSILRSPTASRIEPKLLKQGKNFGWWSQAESSISIQEPQPRFFVSNQCIPATLASKRLKLAGTVRVRACRRGRFL